MKRLVLALLLYTAPAFAQTDQVSPTFIGAGGDFSITTGVSQVDLHLNGIEVHFSRREGPACTPYRPDGTCRWPDNRTPGWDGDLQYSVGLAIQVNGQWFASAPIETWFGNNTVGGQVQDTSVVCSQGYRGQVACNWFYDSRWGQLNGQQPQPGAKVGVFVVAGDPRNNFTPVRERSNIVLVTWPASGQAASFSFPVVAPAPAPTPEPTPPQVIVVPSPPANNDVLILKLDQCVAGIAGVQRSVDEGRVENRNFFERVAGQWKAVVKYATPAIGALIAGMQLRGGGQ